MKQEIPSSPERPTRVRWLVFALACTTSWLLYLHRYAWGVVKPFLREEYPHFSPTQLGWLDSAFNATYALGQVPGGLAGDLLGPRAVLSSIIFLWSAVVAWLGAAGGFWGFLTVRFAFGACQAGTYPNLGKVTGSWFPLSIRTSVQGAVASFSGRAGGACASLVVATLLMGTLGLGWRATLMSIASLGLVFAGVFWLVFRNSPREHPWANETEQQLIAADEATPQAGHSAGWRWSRPGMFTLGMLIVHMFASAFADQLYVYWIPTFLVEEKGLTAFQMGLFASLPLWGGAVGGLCGGGLNDLLARVVGRRIARSAVGLTGKLLAAVLIASSVGIADGRLVMVTLFACKFFGDWSQPTVWGTITDVSGPAAGTVFGIVNMSGSIAAILANPAMGYAGDHWGWGKLFFGVAALYLVASLAWLFIDCTRPVVTEAQPAEEHRPPT